MRLVYLSPVALASFAQRPHHFVHWFHERYRAPVLWIDPYPARLPAWRDLRRLRLPRAEALGPPWSAEPWLERVRVNAVPLEPLAPGRWVNRLLWRGALERVRAFVDRETLVAAGKPSALALELAARHPGCPLLLDVMDNVPAFTSGVSGRWLARMEDELARRARWIVTSSSALQRRFAHLGDRVQCVRNGLVPPDDDPASAEPVSTGPLVFGYVGSIASWFDWGAVDALAARYADATVRLIGPLDASPPRLRPNVELLPAIPQHHVYEAMRGFSVGLIPFRRNALTEYVDPVKYYEYRAMGLPVLSTRFGEMQLRGAADHVLFFDQLDARIDLLALRRAAARPDAVAAFRRDNAWSRRFDALDLRMPA